MDISSLLSPSDELSPANVAPSPRSRPSVDSSNSVSSVASTAAPPPPTSLDGSRRRSSAHTSDGENHTERSGPERADLPIDDTAAGGGASEGVEPLTEEDYQEIQRVLETVATHPYQYSEHVKCIGLLRRAFLTSRGDRKPLLKELREARDQMISIFPMTENMWLEWIEDERSEADSLVERWKVMELCTRAVTDQVASVKLFKAYGEFVEAQQVFAANGGNGTMGEEELNGFKDVFQYEVVVDTYRQGAEATINDIANSHLLWDKYRDLVVQDMAKAPTAEKLERVYEMYRNRLKVPHATISHTFASFSQFVTQYDNANYEKIMLSYNKLYSAAFVKNSERERFELPLKREVESSTTPGPEEWRIWSEYLAWETSQPKKKLDEKLATALYERCLLRFGEQAKVWEDYVYFLMEKVPHSMAKVISVLKRATRHCPWSGALWAQYIIALEKGFKPFEEVAHAKHKATKTELLDLAGPGEVLAVNIAWCGFLKRRAFEQESQEEDLDMAEMGISEAVTEVENGKFQDPDYRLHRIQINFYTAGKKFDRARSIWQELSKSKGTSYEFWQRYYFWEFTNGSKEAAAHILKRALTVKTLDWPEKILEIWRTHVEDFGNPTDVETMMVKYRRFSLEIAERREKEAQEREQLQAHEPTVAAEPALEEQHKVQGNGKRRRSEAGEETQPSPKKAKSADEPAAAAPPAPSVALANQAPPTAEQTAKRDRENCTIIAKNLPPNYPEVKVRQFFRECGTINSLKIVNEKNGNSATATVEFDSREGVLSAQTRTMKMIDGHQIEIQVGTGSTLYVTNFPPVADETYIRDLFKSFGEIVDIRFPSLRYDQRRRFCYVQFSSAEGAQAATSLDGKQLGEKETLVVKISAPNQKTERTSATADGREVYIRNIDFQAKESDLRDIFGKYGKIEKIRLPPGPKKGMHKGFGFIVFESKEDADASLKETGTKLKSRDLDVSIAQVNPTKLKPGNAINTARSTTPAGDQANGDRVSPEADADEASARPPSFEQIKKKTLGIMNLADTVNDTRLRTLFEPFGPLRKLTLRPDHQGAIVEYENVADAGKATLAMEGKELDGMKIQIGQMEDLMKQKPITKVTKGFQKKPAPALIPTSVRTAASAGRGGRGGGRKRGLGFVGAMSKKDSTTADVEMSNADGHADQKKGKSNEEFKKLYLAER
ncbi:hypothetical protein FN846DRAFT_709488 [Sphaerosporella brunnea]|uniref:U4/U6 snRNA-associated-splicing factor PRP24 n=1 Tax=Sphaerosporella brunnea TaxID=1250544 RepID=A0A5J5EXA0_9PEZI|nr:hypothetical protein FN846DRAFT_709488 [Sphaerosporella brunnea]